MGRSSTWGKRLATFARAVTGATRPQPQPQPRPAAPRGPRAPSATGYPGDFEGVPKITYAPVPDDAPDPGEVVWAWVPYEEDHRQGKDRPVVVVARHGDLLLAVMCTSVDHDRDAAQEARAGRSWFDVGSGAWDRSGRPSEVRLDRVLQLEPSAVRREGAALDRATFEAMAAELVRVRRRR